MLRAVSILLSSIAIAAFSEEVGDWDDRYLFIHLIPHTHDDVGWRQTVDEYFWGSDRAMGNKKVKLILDSVTNELWNDPTKTFSYVEMKFFSMWYYMQPEGIKNTVQTLVREGRFEFLNAGWSMHDEACTHYEDMINNMKTGHDFLKKEFDGYVPRVGWQIDPFGHSLTNARLFADMGFDAFFFARQDFQEQAIREKDIEMQFVWTPGSEYFGYQTLIFTHAMHHIYASPPGFDVDERKLDNVIVTDESLSTYNAQDKKFKFYDWINEIKPIYNNTYHMFIQMGGDFEYSNAHLNFANMDKLIKLINDDPQANMEIFYSTPRRYVEAVNGQKFTQWPWMDDDMLPYASSDNEFWTGYYSSRANSKAFAREASRKYRAFSKFLLKA